MISVVILTKNEEKNILDCLETISWADEIIIVDDESEDRTLEIAKTLNLKNLRIIKRKLHNDFSEQRNFAISQAKQEWVLFLDADERVSQELRREINGLLIEEKKHSSFDGVYIKRRDVLWGKIMRHGELGDVKLLRLARKNTGKWHGKVHEEWIVEGRKETFENYLLHYPHQTISEFVREINFYTEIRAEELREANRRTSLLEIIFYPKVKFFMNYFLKLGIRDGIEGLIVATLMSLHSFMVRARLWFLWHK